jgi:hypothetical protein
MSIHGYPNEKPVVARYATSRLTIAAVSPSVRTAIVGSVWLAARTTRTPRLMIDQISPSQSIKPITPVS